MPPATNLFTNRRRANSFGTAAQRYEDHRPGYPDELIADLVAPGVRTGLDVGAGTGKAARQLADKGVDVLAVEPDERMAAVARGKQITTEIGTFETWDPAGRRFDLVTFAASFHWVDPDVALPKVAALLNDGGQLGLLWNRLRAPRPADFDFEDIYAEFLEPDSFERHHDPESVIDALVTHGFRPAIREYPRQLQFSRDQWLELLFTYSSFLTLSPEAASELRRRLTERIGDRELTINGDSLAVVSTHGG